jgi:hypothetical protein
VNSIIRYNKALEFHRPCDWKEWEEGEEQKYPKLLNEAQEKIVLEYSKRKQHGQYGEADDRVLWEQYYRALHELGPEVTGIPSAGKSHSYNIFSKVLISLRTPSDTFR